ncbi:MAG: glycosyltransferase [Terriglobia bacterium]
MTTTTTTTTSRPIPLDDYAPIIGQPEVDELRALAGSLRGHSIQMVNSTAVGGGVAEILTRLIPILKELDLSVRWDVITGGNDFYGITKAFHNALHGGPYLLPPESFETFLAYNRQNLSRLSMDSEFTVIHDPQPVALIQGRSNHSGHWVWRCHIDLSHPNPAVWGLLEPWVKQYDAAIFSSPEFIQRLPLPQYLFFPCIDPLSEKNLEIPPETVRGILDLYGIDPKRPILTQISRFDRLKDPVGVIQAYRIVKRYFDCQLVLAGGSADDDPEGEAVLSEVKEAAGDDPDVHILNLPPWSPTEINALQQASTIIIQKSLREGFGLTVAEALWKKKPVVASAVGGIPLQIIHKHTGLLAHSVAGAAYQIRFLLSNPALAAKLAQQGHEHVREHFLITTNAKRYLTLFQYLLATSEK